MSLPTDRRRPHSLTAAGVMALAAALGAGTALAASPAHAAPQAPRDTSVRVGTGTADFCLAPGATRALATAGIRLTAVAPAKLTGPAGRRCVSAPIAGGAFDLRAGSGHLTFRGGFDFVRKDKRHLKIDSLRADLATSRVTANVGGSKAHRTDFLAFRVDRNRVKVGGGQVRAQLPFTLTQRGVDAFRGAFGRSPLAAGQRVFDGDGTARLGTARKHTPAAPGTARKQTPDPKQKQNPAAPQTSGAPQASGTPRKQTPGTPQGQTPAVAPRPLGDPAVDPVNDVAMDPLRQVAAD